MMTDSVAGDDVQVVFVEGKLIIHNRHVLTVNEKEVLTSVEKIGEKIKSAS
jgi:hypothetical protein